MKHQKLWGTSIALLALGLTGWSIAARHHEMSEIVRPASSGGPLLLDLDDDVSSADRERIVAELTHAIAPFEARAPLAHVVSDEAELYRLDVPTSERADVIAEMARDEDVEGIEPEVTFSIPEGDEVGVSAELATRDVEPARGGFRPDDPFYKFQWHLDQIQMPDAWRITQGEGAVVAVVDTGVLYRDLDRKGRLRDTTFRRAPDLANTRFVPGWDFVDNDDTPDDEQGHGTHVAGTIAQSTNNGVGVAGVAPAAAIMPVRVLDANGAGSAGNVAAGIRWAADHGADVINLSLGGGLPSPAIHRAIQHATKKGVVVVAAAGNSGRGRVEYPAAFAECISVSAVRFDETLSFYSSYGSGLTIAAPGGDLRVDQNADGMPDGVLQNTMTRRDPSRHDYLSLQGTSMATPHVAGVAALLRSVGVRDPYAIREMLTASAKPRGDALKYGAGIVQAASALTRARHGEGGARGLLALLLSGAVAFGLSRRRTLGVSPAVLAVTSFIVAGGLAVLPWELIGGIGATAGDVAAGLPFLFSLGGPWVALAGFSVVAPLLALGLGLSVPRAGAILGGIALGFASFIAVEALAPTVSVAILPDLTAGPWLLANAAFACVLGVLAAKKA